MDAETYARIYGPSTGDVIRLGDTSLLAEVEQDLCIGGYELTGGAGKTMRDGEGLSPRITPKTGALDTVIQSAIIIDANLGIIKADIGIKDGRIVGVGKAGNPDVMPGVDRRLVVGSGTAIVVKNCQRSAPKLRPTSKWIRSIAMTPRTGLVVLSLFLSVLIGLTLGARGRQGTDRRTQAMRSIALQRLITE